MLVCKHADEVPICSRNKLQGRPVYCRYTEAQNTNHLQPEVDSGIDERHRYTQSGTRGNRSITFRASQVSEVSWRLHRDGAERGSSPPLWMLPRPPPASRVVAYEYIGLTRLMPVFEDHLVDELFVDDPLLPPYLEHRTHGRRDLGYSLTERELESVRTHAEIYGGVSPSYRTPSIKTELHLGGVKLRVGLDTYPVAYTGFSLHIRKVGGNALTLTALARGGDVPI